MSTLITMSILWVGSGLIWRLVFGTKNSMPFLVHTTMGLIWIAFFLNFCT